MQRFDVTDKEREAGRLMVKHNKGFNGIDARSNLDMSEKSKNLLSGLCCMAQNLDINGIEILVRELNMRKMELASGGGPI